MKTTSIVLATDLSDGAKAAAVWARDMGTLTGLPVIVAHVIELGLDNWLHGRYQIAFDDDHKAAAVQSVSAWYEATTGEPPGQVEVPVGHAVQELANLCERYDAGLMVIATTGKGGLARAVLGSRVQQLIAMPPCPVAVVDPVSFTLQEAPRIAAAVDFSPATPEVLSVAGSLAQMAGAPLRLVHAYDPPTVAALPGVDLLTPAENAQLMEAAELELKTIADAQLPELEVHCQVVGGSPATALIEYVREARIDVLVMGHTGHWPGPAELLGSTPRRLIREQPCTLVVAPVPRG